MIHPSQKALGKAIVRTKRVKVNHTITVVVTGSADPPDRDPVQTECKLSAWAVLEVGWSTAPGRIPN